MSMSKAFCFARARARKAADRKSTRLNSSHGYISYAVFCLKKKNIYLFTVARVALAASGPGAARERAENEERHGVALLDLVLIRFVRCVCDDANRLLSLADS